MAKKNPPEVRWVFAMSFLDHVKWKYLTYLSPQLRSWSWHLFTWS